MILFCSVCPDGWTVYNGGCYKRNNNNVPQWDNQADCERENANLVTIDDADENEFVRQLLE